MLLENWASFCLLALIATATPGPAAFLVSVNSISVGFRLSLVTVFGNITGLFVMSTLSVLGLSVILTQSALAFTLIKSIGAIYLCYLGLKLLISGQFMLKIKKQDNIKRNLLYLYGQGIVIALTNPKALIFTIALFPQFISLSSPVLPQFALLVVSFMFMSLVCLSTYAYAAHRAQLKIKSSKTSKLLCRLFGTTFIGFGGYLATAANKPL